MDIDQSIEYFHKKYMKSHKFNPRLAKILIDLIEAKEIYLLTKTK
jgi:hypothetical protein